MRRPCGPDAGPAWTRASGAPAGILDLYTQLTGRAATVPTWSLGLWVSRAYYKTPQEAADVAAKLRAHRIPCDVITLDGRAAWNVDTRFDFEWDPERFPDPRAALAAIKENNLRVCVWEYPYVSVHSPLFTDLASRGYLLTLLVTVALLRTRLNPLWLLGASGVVGALGWL